MLKDNETYEISEDMANSYIEFKKLCYFNDDISNINRMISIGYIGKGSVVNSKEYRYIIKCIEEYDKMAGRR